MTCHWRGDHLSNFQIRYNQIRDGKISGFCLVMVVMTDIIHSFHQRYPDINIELYQGTYADVSYWIKNGIVDIGFLSLSSAGDLPIEPLYRDPLLCVVPKGYRTREDTPYMTPDEMKDEVFVSRWRPPMRILQSL